MSTLAAGKVHLDELVDGLVRRRRRRSIHRIRQTTGLEAFGSDEDFEHGELLPGERDVPAVAVDLAAERVQPQVCDLSHYELRPEANDDGCPPMYADPSHDPRMQQLR